MPNRIIKDSICASEKIAALTDFEFRLWIGLITQADDAGRGDARPAIIKGHVFPFRDRITIKDIDTALLGLAAKGCVSLYAVDGRPYFLFPNWTKHQRIRDCKPKYPEPTICGNLPQPAATCGELRPEYNTIQSESKYESNTKSARFAPPTLDEIAAYCRERGNNVDPKRFLDYFAEADWKDSAGKPVKNWKQKIISWEGGQRHGEGQRHYGADHAKEWNIPGSLNL